MYNDLLKKKLLKIAKKHNLSLFILFGSRAKNTAKKTSDWDFAYYPPKKFNIDDDINLYNEISKLLNDEKVDLINLKTSNKLHVINNIFQTGKLIYEKKQSLFTKMRWSAWINLQDFKRYYDIQFELTKKNLKNMAKNG